MKKIIIVKSIYHQFTDGKDNLKKKLMYLMKKMFLILMIVKNIIFKNKRSIQRTLLKKNLKNRRFKWQYQNNNKNEMWDGVII